MDERLHCPTCCRGFITQGELKEHLGEHRLTSHKRRWTDNGDGVANPDKVLKGRWTEGAANSLEALQMDPDTVQPGKLFMSRPLVQGTESYTSDDILAKRERTAMMEYRTLLPRDQSSGVGFANSNEDDLAMGTDIQIIKPEPPEGGLPGFVDRAFREVWVKLYECTICCTPFPDKESCERHFEAHLTKPPLPQIQPALQQPLLIPTTDQGESLNTPSQKSFRCGLCKKIFNCEDSIQTHWTLEHPECVTPEVPASKPLAGKKTIKYSYRCSLCNLVSDNRVFCDNHVKAHFTQVYKPSQISLLHTKASANTALVIPTLQTGGHKKASDGTSLKLYHCGVCKTVFVDRILCVKHAESHAVKPITSEATPLNALPDNHEDRQKLPVPPELSSEVSTKWMMRSQLPSGLLSSATNQPMDQKTVPGKTPLKLYRCGVCDMIFNDRTLCEKHTNCHTAKPEVMPTKVSDRNKSERHTTKPGVKSEILAETAGGSPEVKNHSDAKRLTIYQCCVCKKRFNDRDSCVAHSQVHNKQKHPLLNVSQGRSVEHALPREKNHSWGFKETHDEDVVAPSLQSAESQVQSGINKVDLFKPLQQEACNAQVEMHTSTEQQTQSQLLKHAVFETSQHTVPKATLDYMDPCVSSNLGQACELPGDASLEISETQLAARDQRSLVPIEPETKLAVLEQYSSEPTQPEAKLAAPDQSSPEPTEPETELAALAQYSTEPEPELAVLEQHSHEPSEPEATVQDQKQNLTQECEHKSVHDGHIQTLSQGPKTRVALGVVKDQLPKTSQENTSVTMPLIYQCHMCKKGYVDKSDCVKHVITHIKQPTAKEADHIVDPAEQNSLMLPKGKIVSVVLEKVKNRTEPCESRAPCIQYVVHFSQDNHPIHVLVRNEKQAVEDGEQLPKDAAPQTKGSMRCALCHLYFSNSKALMAHTTTHPMCPICGKRYPTKSHLKKHYSLSHAEGENSDYSGNECEEDRVEPASDGNAGDCESEEGFKCTLCYLWCLKEKVFNEHTATHPLCGVCGQRFANKCQLRKHNSMEHIRINKACDVCGQSFKLRRSYDKHMLQHAEPPTSPRPTPDCSVCGETGLGTDKDLAKHMLGHGANQPLNCIICSRQFKHLIRFINHLKEHADQPEQCLLCNQNFPTYKEWKQHAATHGPDTTQCECKECGQRFSKYSRLVMHIKARHTKDHHYKCEECGEGFVSKHKLQRHMQRHTGVKPYKCDYCDHVAGFKWDLLKHMGRHTGLRPYMCHQCGKTFSARIYLTVHLRCHSKTGTQFSKTVKPRARRAKPKPQVSTNEHGTYPCVICLDAFTTPGALTRHLKKQHPGQEQTVIIQPSVEEPMVDKPGVLNQCP